MKIIGKLSCLLIALLCSLKVLAFQQAPQEIYINGEIHPQGMLSLSSDKKYLTLYGYEKYGLLGGNSSAVENPRQLVMVDALGGHRAISLTNVHGNAAARGAVLQQTGINYSAYLAGSGTSANNGLQQVNIDALQFEQTGSNERVWGMNSNTPRIFDGKLYLSGASNDTRVLEIGTINPATGALTRNVKEIIATGTLTDPLDILVLNGTVLYVADKGYGIRKYYLNGTTWQAAGSIMLDNDNYFVALAGRLNNGIREVYALSSPLLNNAIYKIEDSSLDAETLSSSNFTSTEILSSGSDKGFRGISFAPEPFSTLPIALDSFSGRIKSNETILNWRTSLNNRQANYKISRSIDANNFKLLASLGNTQKSSFSYVDAYPFAGVTYYKLQAYNENGEEQFSRITSVNYFSEKDFSPSAIIQDSNLAVTLPVPSSVKTIRIYSAQGLQLYHQEFPKLEIINLKLHQTGLILVDFYLTDGTRQVLKLINQ